MRYQITYETKGVQVLDVWLPKGKELPSNWESMDLRAQDEWLYENQESSQTRYTDIHHGEAVAIFPVREKFNLVV